MKKFIFRFIILTSTISSGFLLNPINNNLNKQVVSISNKNYRNIQPHKIYMQKNLQKNDIQENNIKEKKNILPISFDKDKNILLYDIKATPEIWAIALVYLVQGLFGVCRLAISFYYKDTLHISPVQFTMISSISAIPWIIKPLYGFISDTFPFFGYKRKGYLVLSSIIATLPWLLLSNLASLVNQGLFTNNELSIVYSVLLVSISSLGIAFGDVLIDAYVVDRSTNQEIASALQCICRTASSLGGLLSAYLSGYLLQTYGHIFVFNLTATIPILMLIAARLIKENKIDYNIIIQDQSTKLQLVKTQISNIKNAILDKNILYPLLFLIIWNLTPSDSSALFYFQVNKLGFQPEFFGRLGLVSSISSLFGIILYNNKLKSIPLRKILKWSCIIGSILGLSPIILVTHTNRLLGISDPLFAYIDDAVISIFGQITFIPLLVLAAKMCPSGVEAMLYATIMSTINLSSSIGKIFGGFFTQLLGVTNDNFMNLPLLILITNITGLIPLMFLHYIPYENDKNKIEEEN
jgi:folate/biopterin transporter